MAVKKTTDRKAKNNSTENNTNSNKPAKRTVKKKAPVSRRVATPPYNPLAWMELPEVAKTEVIAATEETVNVALDSINECEDPVLSESVTEPEIEQVNLAEECTPVEQEAAVEQEEAVVANQENEVEDGFGFF